MLMTTIHPPESIVGRRAERDGVAPERFADAKEPSTIRDFALGLDLAHDIGGALLNGRQAFGEPAGTRLIARRGDGHRQGFMGAGQVIEGAPAVKVLLAVRQIEKEALVAPFRFEGTMKAVVFAQRLGMRGPGMAERNAEADAPDGQGREGAGGPGGAVIHQQAGGQLPAAPRGRGGAQLENRLLERVRRTLRQLVGAPGAGLQPWHALGRIPGQPFIPGLGADGERATQGADVVGGLRG